MKTEEPLAGAPPSLKPPSLGAPPSLKPPSLKPPSLKPPSLWGLGGLWSLGAAASTTRGLPPKSAPFLARAFWTVWLSLNLTKAIPLDLPLLSLRTLTLATSPQSSKNSPISWAVEVKGKFLTKISFSDLGWILVGEADFCSSLDILIEDLKI